MTKDVTAKWVDTDPQAAGTYTTAEVVTAYDAALEAAEANPTTANLDAVLALWAKAAATPGDVLF